MIRTPHRASPAAALQAARIVGFALSLMTCFDSPPAAASFEWDPGSPQSLVIGDSPVRWPVACDAPGLCAGAILAHPFGWPGVTAGGLSVARDGHLSLGSGWSLLEAPSYRESRLALGISRRGDRHRMGLVANLLHVMADGVGGRAARGAALDLAWDLRLSRSSLAARISGVLESEGARRLGEPREWMLVMRTHLPHFDTGLRVVDGSRGRRFDLGLLFRPWRPLAIGAGWSTTEVPLRWFIEVRRQRVALSCGAALHGELPPTPVVALSLLPSRYERDEVQPGAPPVPVIEERR